MSFWYEPKLKDLDHSLDGKDLHIYLGHDDAGSINVSIPIEVVKQFLKKPFKKSSYEPFQAKKKNR